MIEKEKLLLHFCCGPCGPWILDELRKTYEVTAFWYNPNIFPVAEHDKRLSAFEGFCGIKGVEKIVCGGLDESASELFMGALSSKEPDRCAYCYEDRLSRLAQKAIESGIKNFSTTLLASFYQKLELVKGICERLSREHGLKFVCGTFDSHYYESKNTARDMGLYIQKYCGCKSSMIERESRSKKRPEC